MARHYYHHQHKTETTANRLSSPFNLWCAAPGWKSVGLLVSLIVLPSTARSWLRQWMASEWISESALLRKSSVGNLLFSTITITTTTTRVVKLFATISRLVLCRSLCARLPIDCQSFSNWSIKRQQERPMHERQKENALLAKDSHTSSVQTFYFLSAQLWHCAQCAQSLWFMTTGAGGLGMVVLVVVMVWNRENKTPLRLAFVFILLPWL